MEETTGTAFGAALPPEQVEDQEKRIEIFSSTAKAIMTEFDLEKFKADYPSLYRTVLVSMNMYKLHLLKTENQ